MLDRESRSSKGYAFVAYYDVPTAQNAVSSLSSVQLAGRPLRLGFAEDRPDKENPIDPSFHGHGGAQVQPESQESSPSADPSLVGTAPSLNHQLFRCTAPCTSGLAADLAPCCAA